MKHRFVSTVADGSTATDVQPGDWNDEHLSAVGGTTGSTPEVLARVFGVNSSNSSAAVNLINYNVPARALGTNRMLRFTGLGHLRVGSTAVANNYTFEVLHGGSSRWRATPTTQAAVNNNVSPVWIQAYVAAANSSGNRFMDGVIGISSGAAATFGVGALSLPAGMRLMNSFASSSIYAIATGVAENFNVRFNWAAANSSLAFDLHYGVLELV